MRYEEFKRLCRAVEAGQERIVQNMDLLYTGRVVGCERDLVRVEAYGHRFSWDIDCCRLVDGSESL